MKQQVHLHILKASSRFDPFIREIEEVAELAIQKTQERLPVGSVDIVIYDNPSDVIPGFCHGGWTHTTHSIILSLDPKFPNFTSALKKELPRTISHELHHTVRWNLMGKTLLDRMIFEGLASRFEQEVWGGRPSAWATALKKNEIASILRRAKKEFNSKKYDYYAWFFGSGDLPKWTGYSLGYFLVAEYIIKHPSQTAASLVGESSKSFI